jgi:hypothetical protein
MPLMAKAQTLYMRWCLDCHRSPEGHLRPKSDVFVMKDSQPDPHGGAILAQAAGVQTAHLQDCSVCHR